MCEGAVVALICQQFANFEKLITQFKVVGKWQLWTLEKIDNTLQIQKRFQDFDFISVFEKRGWHTHLFQD